MFAGWRTRAHRRADAFAHADSDALPRGRSSDVCSASAPTRWKPTASAPLAPQHAARNRSPPLCCSKAARAPSSPRPTGGSSSTRRATMAARNTAGSGDVLAGITAALAASIRVPPVRSRVQAAAYVHGVQRPDSWGHGQAQPARPRRRPRAARLGDCRACPGRPRGVGRQPRPRGSLDTPANLIVANSGT